MTTLKVFSVLALFAALALAPNTGAAAETRIYIGTYTGSESKGIYTATFDERTGRISEPSLAVETTNPSFLALHPRKLVLYAVGEVSGGEKPGGTVSAFAIKENGKLNLLNRESSGGAGPCHVSVDATGRLLLVANYGGGSVASLPLDDQGALRPAASVIKHSGSSVHPRRQTAPHAHFILPDPANRRALVCDLGLDQLLVYNMNLETGKLVPNDPPFAKLAPGAGPRHFTFAMGGRRLYVVNELDSTVTAMSYDAATGVAKSMATASTLPSGVDKSTNSCAEIQIHPINRFVYASNRGHDSIAVFELDRRSYEMKLVETESTQGKTPRHFAISPGGRWVLAENQNSNSIEVFSLDIRTGKLAPTPHSIRVASPVCVVFAK